MSTAVTHCPVASSQTNGAISAQERERLILEHVPRVRRIARSIRQRLPMSVSLDDLISSGVIGLISAIDRFDRLQDVKLGTYAEYKIRGAMLDSLRKLDWAPRDLRRRSKQVNLAISALKQRLQRSPDEEEIAQELSLTVGEYHNWLVAMTRLNLESMENPRVLASCKVESGELKIFLRVAISKLPEMEKRVLHLHCYGELQSNEIAEILGLTEGRISQLKSQAITRLCAHGSMN